MTLVAAVAIDSYPVIFGDLPVSGAERPVPDVPLPYGVANPPAASAWSIPELDQKVTLLAANCVVAWAGSLACARRVIGELRSVAAEAPLSMARIDAYLAQLDPSVKDEISLVGWVREGELFRQFWYRADIAKSPLFGQVSAAGSGATDFAILASELAEPASTLRAIFRSVSSAASLRCFRPRRCCCGPSCRAQARCCAISATVMKSRRSWAIALRS